MTRAFDVGPVAKGLIVAPRAVGLMAVVVTIAAVRGPEYRGVIARGLRHRFISPLFSVYFVAVIAAV